MATTVVTTTLVSDADTASVFNGSIESLVASTIVLGLVRQPRSQVVFNTVLLCVFCMCLALGGGVDLKICRAKKARTAGSHNMHLEAQKNDILGNGAQQVEQNVPDMCGNAVQKGLANSQSPR